MSCLLAIDIGTSGVVFAYSEKVSIDPQGRVHTFCHAVPDTWHVMAVTQGAGLSLKWFRDNFCIKEMGVKIDEVRASGGGGKSSLWRQMQADVFGADITTINSREGPAMGVALLAGVGAKIFDSVPQACETVIRVKSVQKPDKVLNARYSQLYTIYKGLYHSLKQDFKDLAHIL